MNRLDYLREAGELITGDRERDYGPPSENFRNIAQGVSIILGATVSAFRVALFMAWVKLARLSSRTISREAIRDSILDAIAYLALAGELFEKSEESNEHR